MIFALSFATDTASAAQSQIYVSPTGNDSWDGQSDVWVNGTNGPKKTIKNATGTVSANGYVKIADGTYNENNITINRSMSIIGASKENTIINGSNTRGIFIISGTNLQVNFANLTLTNGNSTAGGAISSNSVNQITANNCIFKNNVATGSGGGAIYSYGQNGNPCYVTVSNSDFINNRAMGGTSFAGSGGAIASFFTSLSVTNSNFINNSATGVVPRGGALHISASSATVNFNRFLGNTATYGGAIYSDTLGYVDATLNWWGTNTGPVPTQINGTTVTTAPWLVLTPPMDVNMSKSSIYAISADLQHDSYGSYYDPTYGHVPNGIPVTFAVPSLGTVSPLTGTTINGLLTTDFTSGATNGIAHPTFTVDSQTVTGNVTIADIIPTSVVVDPVLGYTGDFVDIFATLTDTQNNVSLADVLVDFYVNGAYLGNSLTDVNGVAVMNYYIAQGAGIYPIMAQFAGNDTYSASNGFNNLTVDFIPTNLTGVTNPSISNYSDLIVLTANLTETIFGGPLSGKTIYFSANGINLGSAMTDGFGVATLSYRIVIPPGSYQILAEFLGDESYSPSNATSSTTLNVDYTTTNLTVPSRSGFYNNSVSLSATLTDPSHGLNVNGRSLNFYVNGTLVGNATTNAAGIATLNYVNQFLPGTYPILVTFAGDAGYLASNGTNNLIINYTPSSVYNVLARSGFYGNTVILTASLRNPNTFAALVNKTINFYVNGTLVGSNTTNAAGTATLSYTIVQGIGIYQILAQFPGDTIYNASSSNNTLTVNGITTNLTVGPKSGYFGDLVDLTATLKDNVNLPLSGKNITFSVNGTVVGSVLTDVSGIATLPYNITQGAGTYPIFAQFAGDTTYLSKNATNNLTVNLTPTNMSVTPVTGYYGDLLNLTANLTDTAHGVPLVGKNVTFSVNGTEVGSALTDASGLATLGYNVALTMGSYQILAAFAGDTIFSGSSNNSNLIVNQIPTNLIISPISGYYGYPVNLTATLTDLHNNITVVGKNVSFSFDGTAIGSALTNASGIAALDNVLITPGVLQIMAEFSGDAVYAGSTGTTSPLVQPSPTQILVDAVNAFNGDLVNLTANLTDTAHNLPVVGRNVSFSVNGSLIGSSFTNDSGIAVLPYTVTQIVGFYPIFVQFAGDTTYASNSNLNILNVGIAPTNLLVNSSSGYSGDIVNLTVNLMDTARTLPVVGRTVNFSINGSPIGTAVTNVSGIANFVYTITQGVGNYPILASFAGDSVYGASSGNNTLTVNAISTNLFTDSKSGYFSNNVNLTANLTDTIHSLPVVGRNVSFSVNGILVGTALTDGSGIAVLPYTITQGVGNYSILVQFVGDSVYGLSNGTNNLTVNPTPVIVVNSATPIPNAVNVPINSAIIVTFSQNILAGPGYSGIYVKNLKTGVVSSITKKISGNALIITQPNMAYNNLYVVYIPFNGVTSLDGKNLSTAYSYQFQTVKDTTPPKVTSTVPKDNTVNYSVSSAITVYYSKNILAGVNYSQIYVKNLKTGKKVSITKSISGNKLTIKTTSNRAHKTTYQVYIPASALKDSAGNNAAKYSFTFKTG